MESLEKDWTNNEQKWTNNKVLKKTGITSGLREETEGGQKEDEI